jgi:hypothetical protein
MEQAMQLVIDSQGQIRCLYDEILDFGLLGTPTIRRASYVEPDLDGHWWADLAPLSGPRLGPFLRRSQALACERNWLEKHWLVSHTRRSHA